MQVHCVTSENSYFYADQIEEHYRIRHDIYVKQRKWMDLERSDGREVDQFDNENAVYLLALDDDGRVLGGTRMVPTVYPHLMSEVFPQLASNRGLQCGFDIVEWTRYFVVPSKRTEHSACPLGGALFCAMFEFCLEEGFNSITVVMEMFWLTRMLEMGWQVTPLGAPYQDKSGLIIGVQIEVDEATLSKTRLARGIRPNILHRHGSIPGIQHKIVRERLAG